MIISFKKGSLRERRSGITPDRKLPCGFCFFYSNAFLPPRSKSPYVLPSPPHRGAARFLWPVPSLAMASHTNLVLTTAVSNDLQSVNLEKESPSDSLTSTLRYLFASAAMTKYHRPSGLNNSIYFLRFCRPEAQDQGVGAAGFS